MTLGKQHSWDSDAQTIACRGLGINEANPIEMQLNRWLFFSACKEMDTKLLIYIASISESFEDRRLFKLKNSPFSSRSSVILCTREIDWTPRGRRRKEWKSVSPTGNCSAAGKCFISVNSISISPFFMLKRQQQQKRIRFRSKRNVYGNW